MNTRLQDILSGKEVLTTSDALELTAEDIKVITESSSAGSLLAKKLVKYKDFKYKLNESCSTPTLLIANRVCIGILLGILGANCALILAFVDVTTFILNIINALLVIGSIHMIAKDDGDILSIKVMCRRLHCIQVMQEYIKLDRQIKIPYGNVIDIYWEGDNLVILTEYHAYRYKPKLSKDKMAVIINYISARRG